MAHTLTYSDYSYSSHDESQTEGEGDTLQWRQRQDERAGMQKKTFAKWINYQLHKGGKEYEVVDVVKDLHDGTILLALLEVLTGNKLRRERGRMRLHMLNNVNRVIQTLEEYNVKLVNICSDDIVGGNAKLILGLIWSIILQFQLKSAMSQFAEDVRQTDVEKTLISWCKISTKGYKGVLIKNFTTSWQDGLAFSALIHHHRPDVFDYNQCLGRPAYENLEHAFRVAREHLGIEPLLDPEDVKNHPDKKSILMYLTILFQAMSGAPKQIVLEEVSESSENELQARDSPTPSSVSTLSEWEDYNETLTQVLTWLLQAETQLKQQAPVSEKVDVVKEQFREHEEFMMVLTSHQSSVGGVLEFGSQLINEGIVSGKEEREIREQMTLLSDRWENLRVGAMERQTKLHQALMAQQQNQLRDLADWLTTAEGRMEESASVGSDLEAVKRQVDEHKKFQEDLEFQQQHVNSLSHMVVVVDESENENATADLEEQLAVLGERWSAVCKWTEQRWAFLQDILTNWQGYRSEEKRLSEWLLEKENNLKEVSEVDLGDKEALSVQLQQLKLLEQELTAQQSKFGDFNLAAQQVATNLDEESPAIQQIQDTMEAFNKRWNNIASSLNSKIRLLRSVEEPLKIFLTEYDDSLTWISDNEVLLKPAMASDHMDKHKDLIESLDAAVKTREPVIEGIVKKGEEIVTELKQNHQTSLGLEQCITSLSEKWNGFRILIGKQIDRLALAEKKRTFQVETKRIVTVVTEIEIWIQTIIIEHSKDPQYQSEQIKLKLGELSTHMKALESLQSQARNIEDDSLRLALVREVETIKQRFITAHQTLQQQQSHAIEMIQSTPPPEYQERYVDIKVAVDDALPLVTKEFQYAELLRLEDQMESCKLKQKKVADQEANLSYLNKKQAEMLKNLSPEKSTKLQKQLHELMKLWSEVKGKLEARLQRIRDAIIQTKELQLAMKETFNWMDDVDKFLADLSSTIAEGDTEAVESQVEEVEALQADISTVQKKVDSLIETCTYMMNRAELIYADVLKAKLGDMNKRWEYIVQKTEQEKTKLQNGLDKFKLVDSGIKDIYMYLKSLESMIQAEELETMDSTTAQTKVDQYKEAMSTMKRKEHLVKQFEETTVELLKDAPDSTTSPVVKELEKLKRSFVSVQSQLLDMKGILDEGLKDLLELHNLLAELYKVMDDIDECIAKSSDALDGDEHDLESCLNSLNTQYKVLRSDRAQAVEPLVSRITKGKVGTKTATVALEQYNSRLGDTLERGDKVRHILEGELMKRQQLTKDLLWLSTWLEKTEKELSMKVTGAVEEDTVFNETLKEELSLNQTMLQSAENTVKELMETGKPERHDKLLAQLKGIKAKWAEVAKLFEEVKLKPLKDLEVGFVSLHGNILSEMDNIIRKVKKLKLESPASADIQASLDSLEEYKQIYETIAQDIEKLKGIGMDIKAKTGDEKGAIERSLNEVQNEHLLLGTTMDEKKQLFSGTLEISESVEKELDGLDQWIKDINKELRKESVELPENPEPEIERIKRIIDDLNEHGPSIETLKKDAKELTSKSAADAFTALDTRVTDIYEVWLELTKEARERLETLQKWLKLIDDYEKNVDDLNVWIDNMEKSIELLGYQETKQELFGELEELKKLKAEVDKNETKLDFLKSLGDDIATRGKPSLVQPYEKQLYQRWEDLEGTLEQKTTDIEKGIKAFVEQEQREEEERLKAVAKQLEEEKLKEKKAIIVEEELILPEAARTAESAPPQFVDDVPVNVELVTQEESVNDNDEMWIMRRQTESSVKQYAEVKFTVTSRTVEKSDIRVKLNQVIFEIEDLERTLIKIRVRSRNADDVNKAQHEAERVKEDLEKLQPRIDELMTEANSYGVEGGPEISMDIEKSVKELTRKVSGAHANLTLRRKTLRGVDAKFIRYHTDFEAIKKWLEDAEKAMEREEDEEKMKELDLEIEKKASEMEAMTLRADQLHDVYAGNEVSMEDVNNLRKRFSVIQTRFYQFKKPEEKATTYKISVYTADVPEADTKANVFIKLFGEHGNSEQLALRQSETKRKKFLPGQVDVFTFREQPWLGKLSKIRVWHDNEGSSPAWYLSSIYVLDELSAKLYGFVIDSWLSKEHGAVLKDSGCAGVVLHKELAPEFLTRKHKVYEVNWLFATVSSIGHEPEMDAQQYIDTIQSTLEKVVALKTELENAIFEGKEFENFSEQEQKLKELEEGMDRLAPAVDNLMILRERYISKCNRDELDTIDKNLNSLRLNWNAVNVEFKARHTRYEKSVSVWRQFHNDLKELTLWLTKTENKLAETKHPSGEINEEIAIQEQETLEQGLDENETRCNTVNMLSTEISLQSTDKDATALRERLSAINSRWEVVHSEVKERSLRFQNTMTKDANIFIEDCDKLLRWIEAVHKLITETKPHPIDEDSLDEYKEQLTRAEEELSTKQEELLNLTNTSQKILTRPDDLSPELRSRIETKSNLVQQNWQQVSLTLSKRKAATTEKLSRATKFLEELEELSVWMSATRDLLEKQEKGDDDGLAVDPETMRQALETRKTNVEAINRLLSEFRGEGDLTTTSFPKEVRDKIERLNRDWQIIIQLATKLREKAVVTENIIVAEEFQKESAPQEFAMPDEQDFGGTSGAFESNVKQLHDWLSTMEMSRVAIGDADDMDRASQRQTTFDLELELRKSQLEDAIEMGAALSNEANESSKFAIDDEINKLKEHWESVLLKFHVQRQLLQDISEDWGTYEDLKRKLIKWIQTADGYYADIGSKEPGSTVTELEEQLLKHKQFLEEMANTQPIYLKFCESSDNLTTKYANHDVSALENGTANIKSRWQDISERSSNRQNSLQESLDRLLLFHKNMITALTWLSSAESKVADLDSIVEASQTEEQIEMDELHKELTQLEEDISEHQSMFSTLNETGQNIIADLEPGEVLTALQSKLDDMNDRWNSLGVRVVDIRDRISDGTGEWRQLLLDMQEIVDWLVRADQELTSQKPIGGDIETIQQQNENHQAFKGKLNVRRLIIEQALQQGKQFLSKHEGSSEEGRSSDETLILRVIDNLRKQLAHVEEQWQQLLHRSEEWQKILDEVLHVMHTLIAQIDEVNLHLTKAEQIRSTWPPVENTDSLQDQLDEVKIFLEQLSGLEAQFDNMDGSAKELRQFHCVVLSGSLENEIDQLHRRWNQLQIGCVDRQRSIQDLLSDYDIHGSGELPGSVTAPWERSVAVNKVPYYINHDTKTTQWDHPKMSTVYRTLSDLNDVKFAAYRTAMKLRCIQKACCMDLVSMNAVKHALEHQDSRSVLSDIDALVDVLQIVNVLIGAYEKAEHKESINVAQSVDLALNWLLNVFDSVRYGKIRSLSLKVGLILLSKGSLEEKWKYLFMLVGNNQGQVDQKKFGLLLHDCLQIPRQLGEIAAFGGSNIEPSVRSCFEMAKSTTNIEVSDFLGWVSHEPQSLVWMPVLHRLAAAETAKHEAKCNICKEYPIVGFRYRCLKCFNYDMCQNCFWSGRISKSHRITHPMHQYSLTTTTGEDMADFVRLLRNKFKSRRYRNRPPRKLGYLPVQTVFEGGNVETPSIPSSPAMSEYSTNSFRNDVDGPHSRVRKAQLDDEHRLIQQLCSTLNSESPLSPRSPAQIVATLERDQKDDLDNTIRELEEEHKALQDEYERLKVVRAEDMNGNASSYSPSESNRDVELQAEAKVLRQHKGRLEARMQILEDHNKQLEAQLQRLRQLLEQPAGERDRNALNVNLNTNSLPRSPPGASSTFSHPSNGSLSDSDGMDIAGASRDPPRYEIRNVTYQPEQSYGIDK